MEKIIKEIKEAIFKNWKWIVLFICIIGFLMIAEDVFDRDIREFDRQGYNLVSGLISEKTIPIAKFVTHIGGATVLILITVAICIAVKNKRVGIYIASNLVIATTLNILLKNILQRPRPIEYRIIEDTGYSFPSGHSMISMAFYGFIIYLIYKNIKNKYLKWTLIIVLGILITAKGISRIYLGVHYTSDVVDGFLIAIAYLIIFTNAIKET